uniref:Dehydrogenase/reductase (SDR family) member 11b n=1 Tax=Neolamprologus brichardi TaxID=32507 RepID=A0A3Q4HWL5_NEOBR
VAKPVIAVMERWHGRVALVTGASVGIGAAIAVELVRLGMKVVGCARDVAKIQVCSEVKTQFQRRVS